MRGIRSAALAATAALALALTACGSGGVTGGDGAPSFSGPHAESFARAYENAQTDFQREVIAKGEITRADYEEAWSRLRECAQDAGLQAGVVDEGGLYTLTTSGQADQAALDECTERTTFGIDALYLATHRNPENRDELELLVECLQRAGLVGPEYTVQRLREENSSSQFSYPTDDPAALACLNDPLGTGTAP